MKLKWPQKNSQKQGGGFFWLARIYTPGFRQTRDNAEIDTADDYDDAHAFNVGLAEDFEYDQGITPKAIHLRHMTAYNCTQINIHT